MLGHEKMTRNIKIKTLPPSLEMTFVMKRFLLYEKKFLLGVCTNITTTCCMQLILF